MRPTVFIIALVLLLSLALPSLTACSADSAPISHQSKSAPEFPHVADYTECDLTYSVTVSDDRRKISLNVSRTGGITSAVITSPAELSGISFVADVDGLRAVPSYGGADEAVLSTDAAAGLLAVFDLWSTPLSREQFGEEGSFTFSSRGFTSELFLSEDGFPLSATLTGNGESRFVEFANTDVKGG